MRWVGILVLAASMALSGCSYTYAVKAVMLDGRLAFVVDPASRERPRCVSRVSVVLEHVEGSESSDDPTFWDNAGGYDCEDVFPVFYGVPLAGARASAPAVDERPARRWEPGRTYQVVVVAGATGYGGGRFRVHPDGRVENLQD
jgi:hypothetical protein